MFEVLCLVRNMITLTVVLVCRTTYVWLKILNNFNQCCVCCNNTVHVLWMLQTMERTKLLYVLIYRKVDSICCCFK
jgi:hypothetical protein